MGGANSVAVGYRLSKIGIATQSTTSSPIPYNLAKCKVKLDTSRDGVGNLVLGASLDNLLLDRFCTVRGILTVDRASYSRVIEVSKL